VLACVQIQLSLFLPKSNRDDDPHGVEAALIRKNPG